MSISDMIVVMKEGVIQQTGKPQVVYDDPKNLFVAKFLGTPPINVFEGKVFGGKLFLGDKAVLRVEGVEDKDVFVGIRPEGFIIKEDGPMTCEIKNIEVMGRDSSIVSTHSSAINDSVRSIVDSDTAVPLNLKTVNFALKPHKVFLFDKNTEERVYFKV
jgi:multiple sugar transport system ATP-binding protein